MRRGVGMFGGSVTRSFDRSSDAITQETQWTQETRRRRSVVRKFGLRSGFQPGGASSPEGGDSAPAAGPDGPLARREGGSVIPQRSVFSLPAANCSLRAFGCSVPPASCQLPGGFADSRNSAFWRCNVDSLLNRLSSQRMIPMRASAGRKNKNPPDLWRKPSMRIPRST